MGLGFALAGFRKGVLFCGIYQEVVGRMAGIVIGSTGL